MKIDRWFRSRPVMAERACMALLRRLELPGDVRWTDFHKRTKTDWSTWRKGGEPKRYEVYAHREPPIPGKGLILGADKEARKNRCPVCCQPTFANGDWREQAGKPRWNKEWHACCYEAHSVWRYSHFYAHFLARRQDGKCLITGKPILHGDTGYLLGGVQVDHVKPLWLVAHEAEQHVWPDVLRFWGMSNLQALSEEGHAIKTAEEANQRARLRRNAGVGELDL